MRAAARVRDDAEENRGRLRRRRGTACGKTVLPFRQYGMAGPHRLPALPAPAGFAKAYGVSVVKIRSICYTILKKREEAVYAGDQLQNWELAKDAKLLNRINPLI